MNRPTVAAVVLTLVPLLVVGWFLWPLWPFAHSASDLLRALISGYALFFLSRFLAATVTSLLSLRSSTLWLAFVFLSAWIVSLGTGVGLTAVLRGDYRFEASAESAAAALDAFWCTLAAAVESAVSAVSQTRRDRAVPSRAGARRE
jgi:hypothetical protein